MFLLQLPARKARIVNTAPPDELRTLEEIVGGMPSINHPNNYGEFRFCSDDFGDVLSATNTPQEQVVNQGGDPPSAHYNVQAGAVNLNL